MNTDCKITRLRSLAIIVVVFGHSIILYDPHWGLYSTAYTVTALKWIKHIINTFQMPLFLFLSGFCFFYSLQKHSYKNIKSITNGIIGKAKRLLVPFVVIAVFWMIPIRRLCNYTAWDNLNLFQILKRVFLGLDSGHLWFLPTLFLIFIFAFMVFPRVKRKSGDFLLLLIAFLGTLVASKVPAILFLNNAASSLYWFCLGFECCKYKEKIECIAGIRVKYGTLILSGMTVLLTIRRTSSLTYKFFEGIAVTFLLLSAYNCVSSKCCSKVCKLISDESMGIYLLHSPLVYFTYAYYPNGFPVAVVFINFVVDGFIAFVLIYCIMNSKGKALLGY